jgi:hypothetical protein
VEHEAQVRLVEPHAECRRRHEGLDPVVAQQPFELLAVGRVGAARVGAHLVTRLAQGDRDVLGGRHGEGVDDAAAGQGAQVCQQPGQPLLR